MFAGLAVPINEPTIDPVQPSKWKKDLFLKARAESLALELSSANQRSTRKGRIEMQHVGDDEILFKKRRLAAPPDRPSLRFLFSVGE